mmetsp:Transcript_37473/g.67780  ORF Transcript_37473/g.67780 Transcript_37473/m.67780 type:complete len:211 (+) Transcript_37473:74-706(+)|eukprot:CAMPEP_0197664358 /NCGR_PEP_ID=MMETSP1338-20131121/58586_1 /TAXON_ID=43686 ORGANISM="Pelagodinium beii, Strain RCC1491" /NCGR_SAMPLE_ID=MMETSP1338 /ASSEMBLY_ACC=CAM_ASM_000754 /LENGTH=210 /DNA_ID=CAMNT_0043242975 /DNA_START=72 /DNA_END=704 /DNA_ORIENTATION=+
MYYQQQPQQQSNEGNWGSPAPYVLQMVQVPVMGGSGNALPGPGQGYAGGQVDPRSMSSSVGGFQQQQPQQQAFFRGNDGAGGGGAQMAAGFQYPAENTVLVCGQYREIRPAIAQPVLAGSHRFHIEPVDLPQGLQFDAASGTIWGTPLPNDMDPAGPYQQFNVVLTSASGRTSCKLGLKVIEFSPHTFDISHISQLQKSKYMVLVDSKKK